MRVEFANHKKLMSVLICTICFKRVQTRYRTVALFSS